ncbi:importin subunit alpha-1-like isoform X2 [Acanthaster planci]|uniref:Importin subunit alpha-1-like isoform X2 n=1 Tax=Acanthaster planci TaxID=133434 RepID=A0A8B7ZZH6_ACAPL|nr:importin subunit alpha-1-like isoform X2 [Acanthaster planci]
MHAYDACEISRNHADGEETSNFEGMDHKEKYKAGKTDFSKIKEKRRDEEVELRKHRRNRYIDAKRLRLDETDGEEVEEYTQAQVYLVAKAIQKHGSDRLDQLKRLKRMFAQGSALIDAFLSVDNTMRALVGLLSGHDPALQLQAAWCITNMSASIHDHCILVLQSAAPYLVTYLSGQNAALQDQCCWALGNLAGDGPECRDRLVAQGAIKPLINLLKVHVACSFSCFFCDHPLCMRLGVFETR